MSQDRATADVLTWGHDGREPQTAPRLTRAVRLLPVGAALAMVLLATTYAARMAPGLPYDEPSHWGYVRWIAGHGVLPVIGEPSVGYEAQMGPVGYLLSGLAVKAATLLGQGQDGTLLAARLAGALPLLALWMGMARVVRVVLPASSRMVVVASASVAVLNPMVVAMSMSVQNDTAALALGVWALVLTLQLDEPSARKAVAVGLLCGLAVLAKVVVVPAVAVMLAWPVLRWRRRGVTHCVVAGGVVALVSGWWFIRNLLLYGDLTGRLGVEERLGLGFPPLRYDAAHAAFTFLRSAIAYLWLPGEYFRSLLDVPAFIQLPLAALTLGLVAGGVAALRSRVSSQALLVMTAGVVSVVAWAGTAEFVQAVAFRTAYMALPAYAVLVASCARWVGSRGLMTVAVIGLLPLHAWTLISLASITYPPGVQL